MRLLLTDIGHPNLSWPQILGQRSVQWSDVYGLIKQPGLLWEVYKPEVAVKSLDVATIWQIWNYGERVQNSQGEVIAFKPPLRELEERFKHKWRSQIDKVWCEAFNIRIS